MLNDIHEDVARGGASTPLTGASLSDRKSTSGVHARRCTVKPTRKQTATIGMPMVPAMSAMTMKTAPRIAEAGRRRICTGPKVNETKCSAARMGSGTRSRPAASCAASQPAKVRANFEGPCT